LNKPLRHYVDTNIPVIGDLEREYGSNLEKMSQDDKAYLSGVVADQIFRSLDGWATDEIIDFGNRIIEEITEESDLVSLLRMIADNYS